MATATLSELKNAPAAQAAAKRDLDALPPKRKVAALLEQHKAGILAALPRHLTGERLLKVATIAVTTTPALLECDVPSLVSAIGQCASMGLEPNTVLGHAYLVPFNTKRKSARGEEWVKSVQVIIGYKGLIDLARRSGRISSISAHEVCERDDFSLVYGTSEKIEHKPALGERGDVIGFYAVAQLKDGGYAMEFISKADVDRIMMNSQAATYTDRKTNTRKLKDSGPWAEHYIEMGRKTAIRRLAKYLPLSVEFQTAAALDGMASAGKDQHLETTLDGEFIVQPDEFSEESRAESSPADAKAPHYDAASAEQALREAGSLNDLAQAWQAISKDYADTNRPMPIEVEALYNDRREALAESESKLGL